MMACYLSHTSSIEEFHKECGPRCVPNALVRLNGVYNPMAIPLLNRWTRCVCLSVSVCVSVCLANVSVNLDDIFLVIMLGN